MRKKIGYLKYIVIIVLVILLGLVYSIGKGYLWSDRKKTNSNKWSDEKDGIEKQQGTEDGDKTEKIQEKTKGSETFLIFGVDTRAKNLGRGTRSDSIMVVHVNHETKEVKLASIFRDCYVSIDGHGMDKINHAHSFGGPDLAIKTVNRNFDLDIDKYITVNFMNVSKLIDDIGGVSMDITESEVKYINGYIDELNRIEKKNSAHITKPGTYLLDGRQAVAYTRIRYTAGGDYKRAERQRTILFKIFEKAKDLDSVALISLINQFMDEISTNYQINDVTDMLYFLSKYEIAGSKAFPRKLWGGKVDGVWYGVPVTLEENVKEFHEYLYPDEDYKVSDTVLEISNQIRQVADTPNEILE